MGTSSRDLSATEKATLRAGIDQARAALREHRPDPPVTPPTYHRRQEARTMTDDRSRIHVHRDDAPDTLGVLQALMANRHDTPAGYEPTDTGAWVDWDALARSWLSTTEIAVVDIARGLYTLERAGGASPTMTPALATAFTNELRRQAATAETVERLRAAADAAGAER